jgi:hypothetical protein
VSEDAQRQARSLVQPDHIQHFRHDPVTSGEARFKLTVYVRTADQVKTLNLGSWPSEPYEGSIEQLFQDDLFRRTLVSRLESKGAQGHECEAVYMRRGNTPPTRIAPALYERILTPAQTEPLDEIE